LKAKQPTGSRTVLTQTAAPVIAIAAVTGAVVIITSG
jgi:hypothetical protein